VPDTDLISTTDKALKRGAAVRLRLFCPFAILVAEP